MLSYVRNKERKSAFKEFKLSDGTIIGVFQGNRGENADLDILIKYQQPGKRLRTPAHIHWVIDLLIKKEHERELTLKFIRHLASMYDEVKPFKTKQEQQSCELKFLGKRDLDEYKDLNRYGEYSVDFILCLIELMMIMEKTGLETAHVFKNLIDAMIEEKDIFSLVARAIQGRR